MCHALFFYFWDTFPTVLQSVKRLVFLTTWLSSTRNWPSFSLLIHILIYNIALVSGVQQSDPVHTHTHTHTHTELCPTYSPWNSPGQNTGVGSLLLLQEIFPTQGLNPGLPHCRQILYLRRFFTRFFTWLFSWATREAQEYWCGQPSESSQPRNRTGVSCIASGFSTNCAIREGLPRPHSHHTHTWLHFRIQKESVIYTNSWGDVKYASGFLWQEDRKRNQEAGRGSEVKKASRKIFSVGGANSLS